MIRRPPRSTLSSSSAASDVYKRQLLQRLQFGLAQGSPVLNLENSGGCSVGMIMSRPPTTRPADFESTSLIEAALLRWSNVDCGQPPTGLPPPTLGQILIYISNSPRTMSLVTQAGKWFWAPQRDLSWLSPVENAAISQTKSPARAASPGRCGRTIRATAEHKWVGPGPLGLRLVQRGAHKHDTHGAKVSAVTRGDVPAHLTGLTLASANGLVLRNLTFPAVMSALKQATRPLVLRFSGTVSSKEWAQSNIEGDENSLVGELALHSSFGAALVPRSDPVHPPRPYALPPMWEEGRPFARIRHAVVYEGLYLGPAVPHNPSLLYRVCFREAIISQHGPDAWYQHVPTQMNTFRSTICPVSYTHLTLPTKRIV
eukprot:TRINITY_DN50925_c0_g2_i1.p1 TRINITY_DN50925_c0_g2~~TRINITY_DN50925_c0_g2_i1.p1  ORF type:complete len:371 (+),score=20.66 TRINITY_DN50925_c0_g2_i1:90-1202(+)